MARIPRAVPFVAAVFSGVATSGLLYLHLSATPAAAPTERLPMVISARLIDDGSALQAADCRVVMVAERPAGAYGSFDELEGRLPLVAIPTGQPILSSHLAGKDAKAGLWGRVPPGKRAITIAINEVAGVGGFVRAGQHVDLIGVGSSRVDLQACKLEYSIVSPK